MNIWVMMQKTTLFLPISLETIVLCKEKCNSVSRGCNIWSCNTDSNHDYTPVPIYSVPPPAQFSSLSCPNLCDPTDGSMPVPVHHQLLEPTQTHRTGNILDKSIPHPLIAFSFPRHSVQFSHSVMSESLPPHGLQHARPPCPSPTPRGYSNSCSLRRWCHPAISSSVIPFSSCLQSFPASGSFPMSQFFASGGQSIGVSASTSALPMNTQDWSPLG